MNFRVRVQLKGGSPAFSGTFGSRAEAEEELEKIAAVLNASSPRRQALGTPEVTWLSATGQSIIGADIVEEL